MFNKQLCLDENGNYLDYFYIVDQYDKALNEIEKLNTLIDKLKKYLNEDDWTSVNGVIATQLIKNKIEELKKEV